MQILVNILGLKIMQLPMSDRLIFVISVMHIVSNVLIF